MPENKISDLTLVEAAHLLRPLTQLDSPESVITFLERLGYTVPAADLVTALTEVFGTTNQIIAIARELIQAETDDQKLEILLRLLPVIKDVFEHINELNTLIRALPDLAQDFKDNAPLDELPKRLVDYLLFVDLYYRYPKVFGTLLLMGVLDEEERPENPAIFQPAFSLKIVRWSRIPRYLTQPGEVLNEVYDWNKSDKEFNSALFFRRLELFLRAMGIPGGLYRQNETVRKALGNTTPNLPEVRIPVYSTGYYPDAFAQFGVNLSTADAIDDKKKGIALIPYFIGAAQAKFDISEGWESTFTTSLAIDAAVGLVIRPPFTLEAFQNVFTDKPTPENAGSLELGFKTAQKKDAAGKVPEIFLFGDKDHTHISLEEISNTFYAKLAASRKDFGVELDIKKINILIDTSEGDSFLTSLLPSEGIEASFGLGVRFSMLNGIYFKGSSGIEILLPVHIQLGPIDIENVVIAIKPNNGKIPVDIGATVKGNLGPLVVVVENIGVTSEISFPENGQGNLGPVDMKLGFKAPNGVGLSVDAGIVKGGGYLFLDYDKGLYAGAMQLSVQGFLTLNAIGLISTKMPDGSDGFSMLVIVTAEFMPAFQLGFGFTLIGVGGLLGLNRTVLVDPLREGVQTGTIDNILFPSDVIANAPRIISDLQEIFPPENGSFLVGPMAKIGWGTPTLISLSLGVIVRLPDPFIAILGVLKLILPTEEAPVVKVQVNFLGTIDLSEKLIAFDASLFDSTIAYILTLEGDMILRLKWGNQPDFILSVGGFHPDYTPTMDVPEMDRLTISILDEDNARLQFYLYFALTSNTAQFGARVYGYFGWDLFNITGDIGFDALFQFKPFMFRAYGWGLFTIDTFLGDGHIGIEVWLRGPAPWYAYVVGTVELFGRDWDADFELEWGEARPEPLPEIEIKQKFIDEFSKAEVWTAGELPVGRQQLINIITPEAYEPNPPQAPPGGEIPETPVRIHPFGSLTIAQKLVPLNFQMDIFGNQEISDVHKVSIQSVAIGTQTASISSVQDFFAVAQFKKLTDTQKLSRPSFERFNNGVKAVFAHNTADFVPGNAVRQSLEYEQIYIDKQPVEQKAKAVVVDKLFMDLLNGAASKKSKLSNRFRERLRKKEVPPADPNAGVSYTIGNAFDNKPVYADMDFSTVTEAADAMNALIKNNQALKGNLVLIEQI
jgi:hypothetical protein